MTDYVAGFLFDEDRRYVALLQHRDPHPIDALAGRMNGIGGRIETHDVTAYGAMVREFYEETGVQILNWDHFATIGGDWGSVRFFRHFSSMETLNRLADVTDVGEKICLRSVADIVASKSVVPNLTWLVPLAAFTHDKYLPPLAWETT